MALEICRPSLQCHIRALIALSPEYPQKLFAVCIQTCYIVCQHIFLPAGSQIGVVVKHLITENFLPTVERCKSCVWFFSYVVSPAVFFFSKLSLTPSVTLIDTALCMMYMLQYDVRCECNTVRALLIGSLSIHYADYYCNSVTN